MRYQMFILFTNRSCMVLGQDGQQVPEAQATVSCYHVDREGAQAVLDDTDTFCIARQNDWMHMVDKTSIEYLLGLRTRERDSTDNQKRSEVS